MKKAHEWREELRSLPIPETIELREGRGGQPTLSVGDAFLHSQYRPVEEAIRLVDSIDLDPDRPVLVCGIGLGYHVQVLRERNYEVFVAENEPAIAKLALEHTLHDCDELALFLGDASAIASDNAFRDLASHDPQVLVHPPSERANPGFAEALSNALARASLAKTRLPIAVVGPMYGGSLPIAQYLTRALERLGHRALYVDNTPGWPLYENATNSLRSKKASAQLSEMMLNTMNEWSYARVAEFEPALCIVIAQAPVLPRFAARLREHGIVSAYWFVENWRHMPYWEAVAPEYDYFFHIQPDSLPKELDAAGCQHHAFVPTGCDPELHRPVTLTDDERQRYGCEIGFAGAGYRNRNHLFAGLTDYDFKLWGVDWNAPDLQKHLQGGNQRFDNDDVVRIAAGAAININLHASATHTGVDPEYDAVNPRVFEIAACGGFQLCDPCRGLDRFFDLETELPVYRDLQELRKQIDHFLAHPEERNAIAERARNRALREHTYDARAQSMLDLILDAHGATIRSSATRIERTAVEMRSKVEAGHSLAPFLESLPDETPFTLEGLASHIPPLGEPWSDAQGVFAYLREMKAYSETLLAAREEEACASS